MYMEKIESIWTDELNLESVDATEDFFEIGGHSLIMAKIQYRLKDELDIDVSMEDLFRYSTLSSIDGHLSSRENG